MSQRPGLMPLQSNPAAEYAQIETVAGVCLVGKKCSGDIRGLCTGTVVSLHDSIVLVTSERIIPTKEDLAKVKQNSNEWNKGDYVLCFKSRKKDKLKTYNLEKVTEPNKGVHFDHRLVMIHLDSKKLSDNFKKYRLFKANGNKITDPKPFEGSICQIVNGNSKSFIVESYEIIYDNDKEVLRARSTPGASTFDSLSKLTAGGAFSDRLAFGGGIFKDGTFVGVLIFGDDDPGQIVVVQCCFGQPVEFFCSKTSLTDGTDESEREDDISTERTQDQSVFHNPANANSSQGPDADGGSGGETTKRNATVPHNPANANAPQGPDADGGSGGETTTRNASVVPDNPANASASQEPEADGGSDDETAVRDGTPQKLTNCDIEGNTGWIVMGENNTINVEAPPRKAEAGSGGETAERDDCSKGQKSSGIVNIEKCDKVALHGSPSPKTEINVRECKDVKFFANSQEGNSSTEP